MKTTLAVALALGLSLGVSSAAQAQARSYLGPQIGYNIDYEALVVGVQFGAPLGPYLEFYPSFNIFFVDPGTVWAVNLDLKYRMPMQGADWLYLGGGLNVTRTKDYPSAAHGTSSDARANLIAGIESRRGTIRPFGEARLTVGHGSTVQLVGGLNFILSR
jgi:hypothetical protein